MNTVRKELEKLIEASDFFRNNEHEPNVGDMDCPEVPKGYGTRGQSLYTVFITKGHDNIYRCAFEEHRPHSTANLEEAIRHVRHHHFNHCPYLCVPTNGDQWYASHCPFNLLYSAKG